MKPDKSIAAQIVEWVRDQGLDAGVHLPAQLLADRLRVSRTPVNEALALLRDKGLLTHERNRGYFLAVPARGLPAGGPDLDDSNAASVVNAAYFRIAEDRLQGVLGDEFSETAIKARYRLTPTQLHAVLARLAHEGWAERKPGYGWAFSPMLTTAESLLQSYRLRLAIEPAALLEPGWRLDAQTLARCRAAEHHLLDGGIETDTPDQLHDRGVRFHESLVEASGNPFFIDAIRRVNRVRRLLSYRSMRDRQRYPLHCRQHLRILDLLEGGRHADAAEALREHLTSTLRSHEKISGLLESRDGPPARAPRAASSSATPSAQPLDLTSSP